MSSHHTIQEFGRIYMRENKSQTDSFNEIFLEKKAFNNLYNFVAENTDEEIEIDSAFTVHKHKSKRHIRVKNYVGVIETRDKTTIEILPKIYLDNSKDQILNTRRIFLKMLRHLKDSPFKSIDNALLKTTRFPILEIFIQTFLDELELLIKKGLRKHYVNFNDNVTFLKGPLDFAKQIQHNLLHKERFYINYDEFCEDIPHNRLLKSTLVFLSKKTAKAKNKMRIMNFLAFMEEVQISKDIHKDFNKVKDLNRLFSGYSKVLPWAKVFLLGESFTNFKGSSMNKAILFPMERIFEDYIGACFRKYFKEGKVNLQDKRNHLVDKHNSNPKFKLKPDIFIENCKQNIVLDTKWKLIDENCSRSNYNISQSDMYQLFAYGKKYTDPIKKAPKLLLLYPMHENFQKPLSEFDYGEELRLNAIPVDLTMESNKIVSRIEKFFKNQPVS